MEIAHESFESLNAEIAAILDGKQSVTLRPIANGGRCSIAAEGNFYTVIVNTKRPDGGYDEATYSVDRLGGKVSRAKLPPDAPNVAQLYKKAVVTDSPQNAIIDELRNILAKIV